MSDENESVGFKNEGMHEACLDKDPGPLTLERMDKHTVRVGGVMFQRFFRCDNGIRLFKTRNDKVQFHPDQMLLEIPENTEGHISVQDSNTADMIENAVGSYEEWRETNYSLAREETPEVIKEQVRAEIEDEIRREAAEEAKREKLDRVRDFVKSQREDAYNNLLSELSSIAEKVDEMSKDVHKRLAAAKENERVMQSLSEVMNDETEQNGSACNNDDETPDSTVRDLQTKI